jgi:FixJ family two-component response regulator
MRIGQYSVKPVGRSPVYDHSKITKRIGEGLENREIAAEIGCSVRVVENVKDKIRRRRRVL